MTKSDVNNDTGGYITNIRLFDIFVTFRGWIFQHNIDIIMGTNCAPGRPSFVLV